MEPLRRWADMVIDTSKLSASDLQAETRDRFRVDEHSGMNVSITSFGYARGVPHNADLIFDMRFPAQSALGYGAATTNRKG